MQNTLDTITTGGAAIGGSVIAGEALNTTGDPINLAVQVIIGLVTLAKYFTDVRRQKKAAKNAAK